MSTTVRVSQESRATLKQLADEAGKPMQAVLDRALFLYKQELRRRDRRKEIERFAKEHGGSYWDLDPEWQISNENRLLGN